MSKLYSLAILLLTLSPLLAHEIVEPPCDPPSPPPLRVFTNVVKSFFAGALLVGHNCTVETWTNSTGALFVTFLTDITCDDIPRKLCTDMYNYINRNGWMTGVTGRCEQRCDKMKLILEGQDDPNYDPNVPVVTKPLEPLSQVLTGGFKRAELGDYQCDTTSYTDDYGIINIVITIKIEEAECIKEEVCNNVLAYLDKPGILDGSSHTCEFVDGCTDKVILHLIGSEEY